MGRWVQKEACLALTQWRTLDPVNAPASVSINVSRAELAQSNNFLAQIKETTINLIENLGMTSLAEGVEEPAQAAVLQSLGCRLAQGYLYSRPVLFGQMLAAITKPCT